MRVSTLEEARAERGLRLVVTAGVPSPWSEAAKGWFDVKGVDYAMVRLNPRDNETRSWTGHHNAPVAIYADEPPRAAWAEILELAERLAPSPRLLPPGEPERGEVLGLVSSILGGEGGLVWSVRLCLIHEGLMTEGARGFPVRAARYLGAKYGYAPERVEAARARAIAVLRELGRRLDDGRSYFLGDVLTAADIAAAAAMGVVRPLRAALCPMLPPFRAAYESLDHEVAGAVTDALAAHRDFIYRQHLRLPVVM